MRTQIPVSTELMDELHNFVSNEPNMQACFRRLMNAVLANDLEFLERGKKLNPKLKKTLTEHYRSFLRNAMMQSFTCGFVAFYIRKPEGTPLPFVLPMGSFTWTVEVNGQHSKRRKFENGNCVCRYRIDVLHGQVPESEVHVINYRDPVLYHNAELCQFSPVQHLLTKYKRLEATFKMITECNRWNAEKHVAITESVDLKDQTTSGIQLLDDLRRYTLTGEHGHGPTGINRMRTRNNQPLNTVNDARMYWLKESFAAGEGGKDAHFHCLPANMSVQELSTIEAGRELQILLQDFTTSVYAFFDVPRISDLGSSNSTNSGEQMSRNQYLNVLSACQFVQTIAAAAYAHSFKVDMQDVTVQMNPQARLEVNSAADIKALSDAEVFSEFDKKNLKRLFGGSFD